MYPPNQQWSSSWPQISDNHQDGAPQWIPHSFQPGAHQQLPYAYYSAPPVPDQQAYQQMTSYQQQLPSSSTMPMQSQSQEYSPYSIASIESGSPKRSVSNLSSASSGKVTKRVRLTEQERQQNKRESNRRSQQKSRKQKDDQLIQHQHTITHLEVQLQHAQQRDAEHSSQILELQNELQFGKEIEQQLRSQNAELLKELHFLKFSRSHSEPSTHQQYPPVQVHPAEFDTFNHNY